MEAQGHDIRQVPSLAAYEKNLINNRFVQEMQKMSHQTIHTNENGTTFLGPNSMSQYPSAGNNLGSLQKITMP